MGELGPGLSEARMEAVSAISPERLEELARHENEEVRAAVAANSNTPENVLRELATEKGPNVRYRVAGNGKTPIDLLEKLTKDKNPDVSRTAERLLNDRKGAK
jgi:hypothetical protein